MRCTSRHALSAFLTAAAVLATGPALASHLAGDAQAGVDAGDAEGSALALPGYGAYEGYLHPRDWDWYAFAPGSSGPLCLQLEASGENQDTVRLTVESADRTRSAAGRYHAGGATALALAVPSASRAWVDVTANPNDPLSGDPARAGHYRFALSAAGVPPPARATRSAGWTPGRASTALSRRRDRASGGASRRCARWATSGTSTPSKARRGRRPRTASPSRATLAPSG